MNIQFPIKLCTPSDCTGCEACRAICPTKSISMSAIGSLLTEIPEINQQTCIQCHACEKVCPILHPLELKQPDKAIAAIAKDIEINSSSSSGGIAAVISKWFIENGGVVYGAVSVGRDVFHNRCVSKEDLDLLRGSKYVKSDLRDSFSKTKEDLKNDKKVVFFGTPCQIAGLKNFLSRDYDNLLTVDLICHGTPSQELLKRHIQAIVVDNKITRIAFRDEGFKMRFYDGKSIIYENNLWKEQFKDAYYSAFCIACSSFRDSCYHCRYATPKRVSDITIGDFWGLNKDVKFSRKPTGVSVILPVTDKGNRFINGNIKDYLEMYDRPLYEAVKGNAQLRGTSTLTHNARLFRALFQKGLSLNYALWLAYLPFLPIYYLKSKLNK